MIIIRYIPSSSTSSNFDQRDQILSIRLVLPFWFEANHLRACVSVCVSEANATKTGCWNQKEEEVEEERRDVNNKKNTKYQQKKGGFRRDLE